VIQENKLFEFETPAVGHDLKIVPDQVVKMVNYTKADHLKYCLFNKLCEAIVSKYVNLTLHMEVRWLSRGMVLLCVYELKEEMLTFFTVEQEEEF
jgi:hypothetical protein